ncbi:hypothetical protein JMN12_13565 [Capnocytophaga genosp. AHN8471]|uniref:hypothetical protein n=1 Tax=Capnocytophaga genosp. AHN8471 TaxID=327574 RepID=UPI0019343536|nr:hypothetical protein [Capnocytophaga genosp. AHN8471]MBM0657552.1 hypothetical protein [Capnocytophaga genosp. AHN8471]MBM0658710.1 hypothetical protein [Capnocytophaga genosp. AHN8471]
MNFRKKKDNTVKEQTNQDKELSFFAISVWECIFLFIAIVFIIFIFVEEIIFPTTLLILFMMSLALIIIGLFFSKRSKKIFIKINVVEHQFIYDINGESHTCFFENAKIFRGKLLFKIIGYILRIDNRLYLLHDGNTFPEKLEVKQFNSEVEILRNIINSKSKNKWVDIMPITMNFFFNILVLGGALAGIVGTFHIIAIFIYG